MNTVTGCLFHCQTIDYLGGKPSTRTSHDRNAEQTSAVDDHCVRSHGLGVENGVLQPTGEKSRGGNAYTTSLGVEPYRARERGVSNPAIGSEPPLPPPELRQQALGVKAGPWGR